MDHVFSLRALESCIEHAPTDAWFAAPSVPDDGSWEVYLVRRAGATYFVHREDLPGDARIVIIGDGEDGIFGALPVDARRAAAKRVHRASVEAQRPPMHLPQNWKAWHEGNLVAFFAAPEQFGNFRWVMEIQRPADEWNLCFWRITDQDQQLLLKDFQPDPNRLAGLVGVWPALVTEAQGFFRTIPEPSRTEAIQSSVDLEAVTHGAVTAYLQYDAWLSMLTPQQKNFVDLDSGHSAKLRGPAGSGKTITLEIKLLRELYRARDEHRPIRILFATHSWSMAEQVDDSLRQLDTSGDLSNVDVVPLVYIAQERLPVERRGPGFELLGEDSLSGRLLQLKTISECVAEYRVGDWVALRGMVSESFRLRLEAEPGTRENSAFVWDLMNEISSVLSVERILPGVNAERQYLGVQRAPWMMPLANDAEKRVVLRLFRDYVASLRSQGRLTTDQLVSDYYSYLESYVWNLHRGKEGYDLIFVDELHLFTEQERLVLHSLMKSPDVYPKLFMALDPRQSPSEVYAKFAISGGTSGDSGEADLSLGDIEDVSLPIVHRFSETVLNLVRHVNRSFPAFDLGPDWQLDLDAVRASRGSSMIPTVSRYPSSLEEMAGVFRAAGASLGQSASRTAVLVLDTLVLEEFARYAATNGIRVTVVRGRDDLHDLRYTKKSLVLSAVEYVAGLQFEVAHFAGMTTAVRGRPTAAHQLRRFLSLLYLGMTRSSEQVHFHVNEADGGIPGVLESAMRAGHLREVVAEG